MSPLQKIAMGMVIVFAPAYFEIAGQPYDVLADWLGWLLVVSGVRALRGHLDIEVLTWLAWLAFAVSLVFWFPQLTDLLPEVDEPVEGIDPSVQWAISLPQAAFSLMLVRLIGQAAIAQTPRDRFVAGRFGVLLWGLAATVVLPPVAYAAAEGLIRPTLIGIAVINLAFIYYLFRVHRRTWLGGPGPLEIKPRNPDGTLRAPKKDPGKSPGKSPGKDQS